MKRFLSQIQWTSIVAQVRSVVTRFPVEVGVALFSAIVGILLAHDETVVGQPSLLTALLLSSPVLLALQLVVSLVSEQYSVHRWWPLGGRLAAGALTGAMATALYHDVDSSAVPIQVATAWIVAVVCLVLVWYGKGPSVMWRMATMLSWRFVLTSLFASVLSGGLVLALGALQVLFGLDLPVALYGDVSAVVDTLFATLFFLAGVPAERLERVDADNVDRVPQAMQWLVQFVLLPLVMVFALILYAYAIKVVFFSNLEGAVAGYIVALGIISITAWVITWPLRNSGAHRILVWYHRWLGIVLLPMTGMLIVAVAVRIADYGVTPERYALAAFTAVMVGATVMMIVPRFVDLRALPLMILAVGAVTAIGPLDSQQSSVRSQVGRVETMLRTKRLLDDNGLLDTTALQQLPDSVRYELLSRFSALSDVDTTAAVRLLQVHGINATIRAGSRDVEFAGMGSRPEWKRTDRGRYWTFPDHAVPAIALQGASELYPLLLTNSNRDTTVVVSIGPVSRNMNVRIAPKSTVLTVYENNQLIDRLNASDVDTNRRLASSTGAFSAVLLSGEVSATAVANLRILLLDLRPKTESIQQ